MKSGVRGLTAFAAGLLFGIGLIVSGMTDPARVLAFLDITGEWNPSLALVMAGAIGAAAPAFAYVRTRAASSAGQTIRLPDRFRIDRPLLAGAALFGIGWGLSGLCPGPALVVASAGSRVVLIFVAAMAAGALAPRVLPHWRPSPPRREQEPIGHP